MDENENTLVIADEEEALLPDGYDEQDDIFDPDSWTGTSDPTADAQEGEAEPTEEQSSESDSDAADPTTEGEDEQLTDDAEPDEGSDSEPTTPAAEPQGGKAKLKFKAQIDHNEEDVELDESELPTIYQQAKVTQRVQARMGEMSDKLARAEKLAKSMGYDSYEAMLDAAEQNFIDSEVSRLTDEGVHKEVAEDIVRRKMASAQEAKSTTAEQPADAPSSAKPQAEASASKERDFMAESLELLKAHPELRGKSLPDAVVLASARDQSKSLLEHYTEHLAKQQKAENAKLKKENEILKQNAASAQHAPVKSVKGGGKADPDADDPFLAGFNSDEW